MMEFSIWILIGSIVVAGVLAAIAIPLFLSKK